VTHPAVQTLKIILWFLAIWAIIILVALILAYFAETT
jgi:hypothetical protein